MDLNKRALVTQLMSNPVARIAVGVTAVISGVLLTLKVVGVVLTVVTLVTKLAFPIAIVAGVVWGYRRLKSSSRN